MKQKSHSEISIKLIYQALNKNIFFVKGGLKASYI